MLKILNISIQFPFLIISVKLSSLFNIKCLVSFIGSIINNIFNLSLILIILSIAFSLF
jgi:hypothetical protein